jgi:hypothetical protein
MQLFMKDIVLIFGYNFIIPEQQERKINTHAFEIVSTLFLFHYLLYLTCTKTILTEKL